MGTNAIRFSGQARAFARRAGFCTAGLLLAATLAAAQERVPPGAQQREQGGLWGTVTRWFDDQAAAFDARMKDARRHFENFGREAETAAKTTASGARDAADAVARIPNTRVVTGHAKCLTAPNGAPDCVAAANAVCRTKGFTAGKSVDMTTAEVCPPKVLLSGRSSGAGCTTETFVSRALCQ